MFKPNKPADKNYIAGSPSPLWGRHQRDDAAHRAKEEEWTENWYWRSSWGEESRQRPLLRPCLLHQTSPVHHSLHRCLLLLPPVRLLPGANILPPRVHWLWLVPHTYTVRILHCVWEGRWWGAVVFQIRSVFQKLKKKLQNNSPFFLPHLLYREQQSKLGLRWPNLKWKRGLLTLLPTGWTHGTIIDQFIVKGVH